MPATTPVQAAKRGDVVVAEITTKDFYQDRGIVERVRYDVGIVTNITRSGVVRQALGPLHCGLCPQGPTWIVSGASIDVDALKDALRSHAYPAAGTAPLNTLDDARAFLRQFKHDTPPPTVEDAPPMPATTTRSELGAWAISR